MEGVETYPNPFGFCDNNQVFFPFGSKEHKILCRSLPKFNPYFYSLSSSPFAVNFVHNDRTKEMFGHRFLYLGLDQIVPSLFRILLAPGLAAERVL